MKPDAVVKAVENPELKETIASAVLNNLPDWFGLPDSTLSYIQDARELPFYAVYVDDQPVGFVTRKDTARHTAEVHCMGVLPEHHCQGLGEKLIHALEMDCKRGGLKLMQVKTVDEGHYPDSYDKTIAFYEKMGFVRLEVFPEMWDPWNPCLVLVKPL